MKTGSLKTPPLVQVGNLFDRGNQEKALLDLLLKLQGQAKAHNSILHLLFGHHEFLNFLHDFRYAPTIGPDNNTPILFQPSFPREKRRSNGGERGLPNSLSMLTFRFLKL